MACSGSSDLEFTVQKDKIIFHNWNPKKLDNNLVAIYLWDKLEEKLSRTQIEGIFRYNQGDLLEFVPYFPLLENTEYVLIKNVNGIQKQQRFSLNSKKIELLEVLSVYPTSDTLPENLLRMHINFSQPMKTLGNLEHIKLMNNKNEEIEGVIFNNVYELWDSSQKQLTIIFDPARVKTGLVANKELGSALKPGEDIQFVITKAEDIYGQQLQEPYRKTFKVIPKDVTPPDIDTWKISNPSSGTKQSLNIQFDSPIDKMSLYTRIKLVDENKQAIVGKISISNHERLWSFTPFGKWKAGNYTLKINSRLEDPSGNNLNGLFDHKVGSLKNDKEGKIMKKLITIE